MNRYKVFIPVQLQQTDGVVRHESATQAIELDVVAESGQEACERVAHAIGLLSDARLADLQKLVRREISSFIDGQGT